jgi:hypothetical protein
MVTHAATGKPIPVCAVEYRPANCTRRDIGRLSRVGVGWAGSGAVIDGIVHRGVTSLAEEQLNLFEESVRGRLMFQEQMILALKRDEVGTGNTRTLFVGAAEA